jgi:hypothetical protein
MNKFTERLKRLKEQGRLVRIGDGFSAKIQGKARDIGAAQYQELTGARWNKRIESYLFGRWLVDAKNPKSGFDRKLGEGAWTDAECATVRQIYLVLKKGANPPSAKELLFIGGMMTAGAVVSNYKCVMKFEWNASSNQFVES